MFGRADWLGGVLGLPSWGGLGNLPPWCLPGQETTQLPLQVEAGRLIASGHQPALAAASTVP